jgi:tetratricopeptide (TPR) repeat protein
MLHSLKILCLLIGVSICAVHLLWAGESSQSSEYQLAIKLGDQFFFSREVPGNAVKALTYYQQALQILPQSGEASWRMARALCGALRYELSKDQQIQRILQGIPYAEQSVAWAPDQLPAHFWLGTCYVQYARLVGILKAWKYLFPIKKEMETVLRLDSQYAGGYHVLGAWYLTVPWWLGGDPTKGFEYLYKAVQYQPDYTLHYTRLATFLLKNKRKEEAVQLLQTMYMIAEPHDPFTAIEDYLVAQELIQKYHLPLKEKTYEP